MTASGSSCRLSACSRSWAAWGPFPDRPLGPLGQVGHRGGPARGNRQHCGDDARAALLLQPVGRWTPRCERPGDGTDLLLGRSQPGRHENGFPSTPSRRTRSSSRRFPHSWLYLRRIGALPRSSGPDRSRPTEMVCATKQARSLFSPLDRRLARHGRAAYTVTKLGVPLIWIFPFTRN